MKGNDKDFTFAKFMAGRGFYLAMALCIVGTGTAAWIAVDRTIGSIDKNNSDIVGEKSPDFSSVEGVEKDRNDIGIDRAKSSSQPSKPPSSSQASPKPIAGSAPSTPQQKQSTLEFILPVNGEMTSPFSGGKLVRDKTLNEWRTHNGIDLAAPKGTAVVTAAPGKVSNVLEDAMWGMTVEVLHENGVTTVYCGLDKKVLVKKGDTLKNSQQLGTIGTVPAELTSGEHLHFAAKMNDKWVDPLAALGLKAINPAA